MSNQKSKKNTPVEKEPVVIAEVSVEETPEVEVQPEPAKAVKAAVEPFDVITSQLNIYENRVLNVPDGARVAVVENLGEGYLYVDNTGIQYTSNYEVGPGEKKEYKGAKNLFLSSASRPNIRISFYK